MVEEKKLTGYPSIDKSHLNGTKYFERHPIIPNMSIVNVMKLLWMSCPNDPAVIFFDKVVTHSELLKDSLVLAKAFKGLGVRKGDIISVSIPNFYQGIVSFIAANRIGAIVTFLNPFAQDSELIAQIKKYDSPLLINYDKMREYNVQIKKETNIKNIITLNKGDEKTRWGNKTNTQGYSESYISYSDLQDIAKTNKGSISARTRRNADALILFTSGSTGNPKDMLFTNHNVIAACIYYKNSAHLERYVNDNRRWMGVVPFMYPYKTDSKM